MMRKVGASLRFGLRPRTDWAIGWYWLAWSIVIAFDAATQTQDAYGMWQLSPYAWWIAPLVLWWTCPNATKRGVLIAWSLAVMVWTVWRFQDLVFAGIRPWQIIPADSAVHMLQRSLKAAIGGLVVSIAFTRQWVYIYGRMATKAALFIGLSVAVVAYSYAVLDLSSWEAEPLTNLVSILNGAIMALLLTLSTNRLQRMFAPADVSKMEPAAELSVIDESQLRPRIAGFPTILFIAIVTMVGSGIAWGEMQNLHFGLAVGVMGSALAVILSSRSGSRVWRLLGSAEWVSKPLFRVVALVGRGSVLAAVGMLWVCAIWIFAPSAGHEFVTLLRSLPGPLWSVRVDPTQTTITFEGELSSGAAKAVRSALRAHPSVTHVELNSPGGLVYEGELLAKTIQSRGLVAVVRKECSSACTSALAAGRERWLLKGAGVGLHASSVLGLPARADAESESYFFRVLGVAEDLARRGAVVPFWDIWFPTEQELLDSKMITRVVNEKELAAITAAE